MRNILVNRVHQQRIDYIMFSLPVSLSPNLHHPHDCTRREEKFYFLLCIFLCCLHFYNIQALIFTFYDFLSWGELSSLELSYSYFLFMIHYYRTTPLCCFLHVFIDFYPHILFNSLCLPISHQYLCLIYIFCLNVTL